MAINTAPIKKGMPQFLLLGAATKLKTASAVSSPDIETLRRWLNQLPDPDPDFANDRKGF